MPFHQSQRSRTREVVVYPRVAAEDVLAGRSAEDLGVLHQMYVRAEQIPDAEESSTERMVRSLLEVRLQQADSLDGWYGPLLEFDPRGAWLDTVRQLRVRNQSDCCEVTGIGDLLGLDHWWEQHDEGLVRIDPRHDDPKPPFRCLGLRVEHVSGDEELPDAPDLSKPVRPYGTEDADIRAVEGLVKALGTRVKSTLGGADRLKQAPVLAALCPMAVTIWTAMKHPAVLSKHKAPRCRLAGLKACVQALGLGEHHNTAWRILVRDHPAHIHVDIRNAPDGWVPQDWGGLGIFATHPKNHMHLIAVDAENHSDFRPRILHSLLAPEPL